MRQKTMYAERPESAELVVVGVNAYAFFRENIEEVEAEDGVQYQADEYVLPLIASANIEARFEECKDGWREVAIQQDYDDAAAAVRRERNQRLTDTDYSMSIDNIELPEAPTASTFAAWKPFLEDLAAAVNGDMAVYRQALRDVPQQDGFPYDVVWPEKP